MKLAVIDTNVLVVANRKNQNASAECVQRCIRELEELTRAGRVAIDEGRLILEEYMKHASFSGQPGVGDVFFRWLFNNQANPERCERARIHENEERGFDEFPDDPDLAAFDRDDRKFVAVASAASSSPDILNAVDSDWWEHRAALRRHGFQIGFPCPEQFSKTRRTT